MFMEYSVVIDIGHRNPPLQVPDSCGNCECILSKGQPFIEICQETHNYADDIVSQCEFFCGFP